jgi:pSer/pThr/pTyr-binding forkhead associated (FHA) protein
MELTGEERPVLIGQTGPLNGNRWVISEPVLIGRDANCDIVVPDRQISRHHARLTPLPEGVLLEDLGSKNGTHRNGERVNEPVMLHDGDILQVALAQQLVYLSSDATIPLEAIEIPPLAQEEPMLRLEKRSRRVWIGETEILPPLSVAQFQLLAMLYERSGLVVTRQDLITGVWGEEEAFDVSNQALDALIRRLRDRLATVDPTHQFIVTIRGHGLRLENPMPG